MAIPTAIAIRYRRALILALNPNNERPPSGMKISKPVINPGLYSAIVTVLTVCEMALIKMIVPRQTDSQSGNLNFCAKKIRSRNSR
ncbi:MAG TPA: hypothetical protein VF779_11805, partial [Pyrinomonadaceae bacterium]